MKALTQTHGPWTEMVKSAIPDAAVVEGESAHVFCLYGALVDCLGCGDRQVIEAIQRLLRRLGEELAFASPRGPTSDGVLA